MPSNDKESKGIPVSNNNNLYYIDRSFLQFAREYTPNKSSSSINIRSESSMEHPRKTSQKHESKK